jgi:Holliday junction resolvase RusA-like endonuclease
MPKRESYLRIFVTWQRSTYRRADVDNAVKCLGDALQEALGVDDSKFEFTTDRRYGSTDLMEVQIVRRTAEKT